MHVSHCEEKSGPGVDCQNSVSGTTLKRALEYKLGVGVRGWAVLVASDATHRFAAFS